jgi:rubrerythrin
MNRGEYEKILADAISAEIGAQRFYQEVADKMTDTYLKKMFTEFVAEEKKHEEILRGFSSSVPDHLPFMENRDFMVAETVDTPQVSSAMKPADAFSLAMKNEETAMKHYTALAEGCTDPEQKQIFLDLAAMERAHKFKMEKAFVDIGYPEVW